MALALAYASDARLLMPGPITTAHGTLAKCSDCHSNAGEGPLGWFHAVFAPASPREDSANCLNCHKMTESALNPHGIELARLRAYTRRLEATPAAQSKPMEAQIRGALLPVEHARSEGIFCATCHREHMGQSANLKAVADARCHSCHAVEFGSFDDGHPKFENYPFRRRTRINFDHGGHFGKHFPDWRSKHAGAVAPGVCTDCHTVSRDSGYMDVKPFAQVCSACHLGQILGTERATGPKGIAFFALPGLDIETLKEKKAGIGEWPEAAEDELPALMKVLIGRDKDRRQLLAGLGDLDLLDLTNATDEQIAKVSRLAWEIKFLLYALTTEKGPEVLKRIGAAAGTEAERPVIAELTANLPRDVLINAQREWLPNLASEIDKDRYDAWIRSSEGDAATIPEGASVPPARALLFRAAEAEKEIMPRAPNLWAQNSQDGNSGSWRVDPFGRLIKGNTPPDTSDADSDPAPEAAVDSNAGNGQDNAAAESDKTTGTASGGAAETGDPVDAESWSELGGWYRQDFAILYRPSGHADRFMSAWLNFTARHYGEAPDNVASPAFRQLSSQDAQGQCAKCHSVDAASEGHRTMNWRPSSPENRESRFTRFNHEPHFTLVDQKGCLACHEMSGAKGYLDSYKALDPYRFVSNFKPVDKEMCASCHGKQQVREDCLLCHTYHVNGVVTPVSATRIPEK